MTFEEHNNRLKANKFAEYITGQELRKYAAKKVRKYVGNNPIVFDGACGSGQLEQHVHARKVYGVEIQQESCESFLKNFPTSEVSNQSFFTDKNDIVTDCVIMNPPFSIAFKGLPEEDKNAIQEVFSWKKSGKVDDIFVLKSLKHTKRFAFYILFPGVAYRGTEKKFRELIGNQLAELNVIQNAFDDTSIDVLFIVIDKNKTSNYCTREIYDCKARSILLSDNWEIDFESWETPRIVEEKEKIDIDAVNKELDDIALKHLEKHLASQLLVIQLFNADIDLLAFIAKAHELLDTYALMYKFGSEA